MTDDTFERTGPGEAVVRLERRYPHPIAKVWQAVTEPDHLSAWFPSNVDLDLRVGGEIRFSGDPNQPDAAGRVTDVDPPHLVAFTWDADHLRFDLSPDGDGTLLRLTHTFGDVGGAAAFAAGWDACFEAIPDVLAGREPRPRPPSLADFDRYVRLFDLDEVEIAEWRSRFEKLAAGSGSGSGSGSGV